MLTVWLDVMTPKQVWLFDSIKRSLESKGHKTIVTSRVHDVVVDLLKMRGISQFVAGEYGGDTLEGKLRASSERVLRLAEYISQLYKKIDFSFHFSSPEAARVAFGLRLKSICLSDTPHSIAVAKLTFPLSTYVVSPACIDPIKLTALGANPESIVQYDGVDEAAWIPSLKPDPSVLKSLNLSDSEPIVVVRPEESKAAYYLEFKDRDAKTLKATQLIREILKEFPHVQVVVIPRYEDQRRAAKREFGRKVIVPDRVIDAPSLLAYSTLSISGGGTMSWESALLGVPSMCHFPLEMDVQRYLEARGFPIRYSKDMDEVIKYALSVLRDPDRYRVDTRDLIRQMESPMDAINRILEKHSS